MTTQTQRLTYDEYLELPEIKQRYDIVDGEMIMAPAPTLEHQNILLELAVLFHQFVRQHSLGRVVVAPADVVVQRNPLRTRQPDIFFVSNARKDILGQVAEGGPDLVVEILSPSNTRRDVEEKLADYAQLGVRECWLISPQARTVEILRLADGQWQRLALCGVGDSVRSEVLAGLELEVSQIFV